MQKQFWQRLIFPATFLVYSALFIALPKGVFWSPDEGFRLIMARSLTTPPAGIYPLIYPGAALDRDFRFFPDFYKPLLVPPTWLQTAGSVQYPWPKGFPWATGLLYQAFGVTGLYLIPWLSGLLILWLCWRTARWFDPQGAFWVVPMAGLATPVLFYSLSYWDHTLAVLSGMAALWLITKPGARPWVNILASLFLAVAAMLLRVEMAVWLLALAAAWGILFLWELYARSSAAPDRPVRLPWRQVGLFGLLLLAVVLLSAFIPRLITFRHIVEIRNFAESLNSTGPLSSLYRMVQRVVSNLPGILINVRGEEGPPLDDIWNIVGMAALIAAFAGAWIKNWKIQLLVLAPAYLALFLLCAVVTFMGAPFRSVHSLFLSAPLIALSALIFPQAAREKRAALTLTALSALLYLAGGVVVVLLLRGRENGGFWPGLEWGPRYLLMIYPLFGILSLWAVRCCWVSERPVWMRRLLVGLAFLLIIQSALLQGRGMLMLFENKSALSAWQAYLLDPSRSGSPVVTDIWWLPESLADYFTTHDMFYMKEQGDELQWLKLAANQGVTRFTFVDSAGQDLDWMAGDRFQVVLARRAFINGLYFSEYQVQIHGQ